MIIIATYNFHNLKKLSEKTLVCFMFIAFVYFNFYDPLKKRSSLVDTFITFYLLQVCLVFWPRLCDRFILVSQKNILGLIFEDVYVPIILFVKIAVACTISCG